MTDRIQAFGANPRVLNGEGPIGLGPTDWRCRGCGAHGTAPTEVEAWDAFMLHASPNCVVCDLNPSTIETEAS